MKKKLNLVEWAMHYRQIVILVACIMIALGIYALTDMRKNEFPDYTIRQGIVVAACPGYTAAEIEEQVTRPLEDYIFSYKEVKKEKTISTSKDGLAIIQVELNDELNDKDAFWNKFKHGVSVFKSSLPKEVLAIQVQDDFGDTSALLITMESKDKTYRELNDYMDDLKDRLRTIESVGRMSVSGMQKEQISVYLDNEKMSHYGIGDKTLAVTLFTKGFVTTGGKVRNEETVTPIYVSRSINTLRDVQEMIVYSDPAGNVVRLKDIANVVREYPHADSYITNNGEKCILLSVEMKKGKNVVQMGDEVKEELAKFEQTLPEDVKIYKITDQSQVVGDSVVSFLKELLIAIVAVIIVVMLLLPMRVALVAASTIPISIFISLALFYAFGIELNTVTLAALIVTLGMIVDNSIVIIDSYLELISEGMSRWNATIYSATHFFKSILSATMAISVTFFPFLFTMTGMINDFLLSFPWAISIVLLISLMVAELLVPFLQFTFIKKPMRDSMRPNGKKAFSFLDMMQNFYNKVVKVIFRFPRTTIAVGGLSVVVGAIMLMNVPQQLMPVAERNQFAVEITLPEGSSIEKTSAIADSLEHILRQDSRVLSVASFKGCSSPRFHTAYAPQVAGTNFAQFIVNTPDNEATEALLDEYTPKYSDYFPEATVRFKQLSYSEATYPVEVRISGGDLSQMRAVADSVEAIMDKMPELMQIRTSLSDPLPALTVKLDEDQSTRLGVSNAMVESTLAMRYGDGFPLATIWDGDYDINVVLKSDKANSTNTSEVGDELIPVAGGLSNVPLRQIASIEPTWENGKRTRRNGVSTITVHAEMVRGEVSTPATLKIKEKVDKISLPDNVKIEYGGDYEKNNESGPKLIFGLLIAVGIIFFIMLQHFSKVKTSVMLLIMLLLCTFGTAVGIVVMDINLSVTCILGVISLMGILVRNSIIMIDYAEELRETLHIPVKEAIYLSAQRRMRPIFLTSAAASMGVIPMIIGGSSLWMPMGTVIFFGTMITMVFILTVIPVSYWLIMKGTDKYTKKA